MSYIYSAKFKSRGACLFIIITQIILPKNIILVVIQVWIVLSL